MGYQSKGKKPTNLSIDSELVKEARDLGVNLSSAAESGLIEALSRAKSDKWKKENAKAITGSNEWVEQHGVPLSKYRRF